MPVYQLSKNIKFIKINKEICGIYQPWGHTFSFVNKEIKDILTFFSDPTSLANYLETFKQVNNNREIVETCLKKKLLLDINFSEEKKIKTFGQQVSQIPPKLKLVYVIASEKCNLRCKYCFVEGGTPQNYFKSEMSTRVAKAMIDFLNKYVEPMPEPFHLTFYGGEPLLNFPVVAQICLALRKLEREGKPAFKDVKLSIVTNGTLINETIAKFFIRNNISISISIDGPKDLHDKARVFHNGTGSYDRVAEGYYLIRKHGGNPSISCTIGAHNFLDIDRVANHLAFDLEPRAVGFNLMRGWQFGDNNLCIPDSDSSYALFTAFEILREKGIYEDRMMRRLSAITEERIRPYDCSACGDQLVFLPNGDYGPCHAYYPTRKYFFGNVFKGDGGIKNSLVLKEWRKRTPFLFSECIGCPFIAICGGGCAYEAEIRTGSFWGIDKSCCTHCELFVDWCAIDLFKQLSDKKDHNPKFVFDTHFRNNS